MSGWEWLFALLGVGLVLIPWGLSELGVQIPHPVLVGALIVGALCIVGAFAIPVHRYFFTPLTYIYLYPGRGLGERSVLKPNDFTGRRVFVLEQVGPAVLTNVELILHDDRAQGQATSDYIERYPEVDPGESDSHAAQPKHFWLAPSTPWDEDYTITIRAGEKSFLEHIIVRGFSPAATPGASINPPPAPKVTPLQGDGPLAAEMGEVEFAIRLTTADSDKTIFTCQDPYLQNLPSWSSDKHEPCVKHSREIPSFEGRLDPKPFVLVFPGGMIDMTPNISQGLPSHPETEPSTRNLSGWQKARMKEQLEKFQGQKILILVAGDSETWKYAKNFRDVFYEAHWKVEGPLEGPKTACTPVDVSLWTWKNDFSNERAHLLAVRKALEAAGVKGGHRHNCVLESRNALVLWVGVKSPNGANEETPACIPESSSNVDRLVSKF
jgi:hypothetical protein